MRLKDVLRSKLLPVTVGAVVVALAAGGVAYATTPSTTTSSAPAPSLPSLTGAAAATGAATTTGTARGELRAGVIWLVRHTVHADLVVDTASGFRTIEIDRGRLQAVSSTTITIVRPDGPSVSATITPSTKFIGLEASQLSAGDGVVLVQHAGDALYVASRAPASSTGGNG